MSEEQVENVQNDGEVNIAIEPIINEDEFGNVYRYFRVKNGPHSGVVFTLTEIRFIKNSELENYEEQGLDPEEETAVGRILFEDTVSFTSGQLLSDSLFGAVVRDVFDKMVEDFAAAAKEAQNNNDEEVSE